MTVIRLFSLRLRNEISKVPNYVEDVVHSYNTEQFLVVFRFRPDTINALLAEVGPHLPTPRAGTMQSH